MTGYSITKIIDSTDYRFNIDRYSGKGTKLNIRKIRLNNAEKEKMDKCGHVGRTKSENKIEY